METKSTKSMRYLGLYVNQNDYDALLLICKLESRSKSMQIRKLIRDAAERLQEAQR